MEQLLASYALAVLCGLFGLCGHPPITAIVAQSPAPAFYLCHTVKADSFPIALGVLAPVHLTPDAPPPPRVAATWSRLFVGETDSTRLHESWAHPHTHSLSNVQPVRAHFAEPADWYSYGGSNEMSHYFDHYQLVDMRGAVQYRHSILNFASPQSPELALLQQDRTPTLYHHPADLPQVLRPYAAAGWRIYEYDADLGTCERTTDTAYEDAWKAKFSAEVLRLG